MCSFVHSRGSPFIKFAQVKKWYLSSAVAFENSNHKSRIQVPKSKKTYKGMLLKNSYFQADYKNIIT